MIGSEEIQLNLCLPTLPIPDEYRVQFEANINSLDGNASTIDFPQNSRKISVVNGSGIGNVYLAKDGITEVIPGFEIVNTTLQIPDVPFVGTARATFYGRWFSGTKIIEYLKLKGGIM